MTTTYLEVGDNKWGIIVCYDYTEEDHKDMWSIMRSFGVPGLKAKEALRILSAVNTGMAVSNEDLRMSAIFISDATNESEWWSSLTHELYHVANAIIDYYGEEYDGEPAAYLYGELVRMAVSEISSPCF